MGYGIISFFCVLAPEGMNTIVFGRDKGERSEGRGLFWYCLRDAVNDDKIIPQALSLYMINLSLYCRDISFVSMYVMRYMMHIL